MLHASVFCSIEKKRKWLVLLSIKVRYQSAFVHQTFPSDSCQGFFIEPSALSMVKKVDVYNLVLTKKDSILVTVAREPKAFVGVSWTIWNCLCLQAEVSLSGGSTQNNLGRIHVLWKRERFKLRRKTLIVLQIPNTFLCSTVLHKHALSFRWG